MRPPPPLPRPHTHIKLQTNSMCKVVLLRPIPHTGFRRIHVRISRIRAIIGRFLTPILTPIPQQSVCGYGQHIIVGRLSIIVGRLYVEPANSPYQTCLIFHQRLSCPTRIGRLESVNSHRPTLRGPSEYGPLDSTK